MALNLFWSIFIFDLLLGICFSKDSKSPIRDCSSDVLSCVELSRDHPSEYVDPDLYDDCCWKVFCFRGLSKSIIFLWVNPVLKVKFNETLPNKFMTVRGGTVMEVEDKRGSYNLMYTVLHWLRLAVQRDVEEIPFAAFNQSCIGVYSNVGFKAELFIKNLEPWYLATLGFGIVLFLSAESWSRNVKLHYGCGMGLGVMASILVLLFMMNRMFPQSLKKLGYLLMAIGCSTSLYLWTYITNNIFDSSAHIFVKYWQWILGYVAVSAIISFAVCYRYGPVTEPRTLNIIKWFLQFIALVFIFFGTQILEASVALIVVLITLYNLPPGLFNNRFTRYIRYKIFKPKIRLLTEEEYQQQGLEETKKALEELRSFCQSPECKPWKTISRLRSPNRFADFVEGNSWHVTDDELLEYDSGPDVLLRGDDDDSDQEIPVQRPNNPPDSTEGGEIIDSTDEEDPTPEETSDQSIDGPPLS